MAAILTVDIARSTTTSQGLPGVVPREGPDTAETATASKGVA